MADGEWYYASGGQQLGPVSFDELLALTRNGSVKRDDLVWTASFSDWMPAASVPDLWPAAAPVSSAGPVPPPPPVHRPQAATGQGPQTSSLAVISLVCGALSFFTFLCLVSFPGVICGHIARAQIRRRPDAYTGMEYATIGLILNYLNLIITIGGFLIFFYLLFFQTKWH